MPKLIRSLRRATLLLRQFGWERFAVFWIYWALEKYPRSLGLILRTCLRREDTDCVSQAPILIYQNSKAGSTSLEFSLQVEYQLLGLHRVKIHRVHCLENLDLHEQHAKEALKSPTQIGFIQEWRKLREEFDNPLSGPWKIISVIRDPIARRISAYFSQLDYHQPDWFQRFSQGQLALDDIRSDFVQMNDEGDWFDEQIKPLLGIDIYASEFPHGMAFKLYHESPKASLLIMRLEDLDRVAQSAIEKLLGLRRFKLYSFNIGEEQSYAQLYRQFNRMPLPSWYVDRAYNTRFARHFYSETERRDFATRWLAGQF